MATDDPDAPAFDSDRAAILARRQRFVALALSGLASSAGCTKSGPKPCLDVAPIEKVEGKTVGDDAAPTPCLSPPQPPSGDEGGPRPCLNVQPVDEPPPIDVPPQPCLDVAPPPDGKTDDPGAARPCLSVRREPTPKDPAAPPVVPCLSPVQRK